MVQLLICAVFVVMASAEQGDEKTRALQWRWLRPPSAGEDERADQDDHEKILVKIENYDEDENRTIVRTAAPVVV